jgi:hypothetical protein
MRPLLRAGCPALLLLLACGGGGGGGGGGALVQGTAHLLNGSTGSTGAPALNAAARSAAAPSAALSDAMYRITPARMTVTVTGVSFDRSAAKAGMNRVDLSGCTATFDLSKASLTSLGDCALSAPEGTWTLLTVFYSNTYQAVFDDAAAGLYSTSSGLSTSEPQGGAQPLSVTDQNAGQAEGQLTVTLPSVVTFDAGHPPEVYVVFNPIHWMATTVSGGSPGAPRMSGNPPIIASTSSFGKAQYYTNVGTLGATPWTGDQLGLVFLYFDAATPYLVTQVDGNTFLPNGLGYADPAVSFDADTLEWGLFGRLGLDADGVLAWAPAYYDNTGQNPVVLGYRGVAEMEQLDTVGSTTSLSYRATTSPPAPSSGVNYSSGHPSFTPDGSYTLTLLVN